MLFCSDTNVLFLCSVANKVPVFLFVVLLGEILWGDTGPQSASGQISVRVMGVCSDVAETVHRKHKDEAVW